MKGIAAMSNGGKRPALGRIIFLVGGAWFYFAGIYFFLLRGLLLGGIIFLAAGTWFLVRGLRWRR